MKARGKYIASSIVVEYRIEVRLTDCAVGRSLSLLASLLLVFLWLILRVLAAVHVEVVWIASQWSVAIFSFLHLLVRSLLIHRLAKHFTNDDLEECLICEGLIGFEPISRV